ncbi:MAG: hypothetical protein ABIR17_03560 [Pseudolysinimonas sp.]|uniref:hypothetical protein n=1 Tax=Pseudolysinimonas sp. TaxID=2680009 RepID=UPI0032679BAB
MAESQAGLVNALESLPVYQGVTWRAATGALAGGILLPAPVPTSRDLRIASANFTAACVWAIVSSAGRDVGPISADPAAREVAILPGSSLSPASALHDVSGLTLQVVIEIRPGVEAGRAVSDDDLVVLIESARATAAVTVRQPGRFGP